MRALVALALAGCAAAPPADPPSASSADVRFTPQASGTRAGLRGVAAVSSAVAWASGTGGTVVRTIDGGTTWHATVVPGAEALDFRSLAAFDAHRALVMNAGEPARIYATTDGGATFALAWECPLKGVFFDALVFADQVRGFAFSDPVDGAFVLFATRDAGATWTRIDPKALPAPLTGEAAFAASGTSLRLIGDAGIAIGTGGASHARVLRSGDDGATWNTSDVPLASGRPSRGIFSLALVDALRWVAVGGDHEESASRDGTAAWTSDGGATWTGARVPPRGYRSAVAIVPWSERVIAVGPSGSDASDDGGATWLALGDDGWNALAFAPRAAVGWVVGANGKIARVTCDAPAAGRDGQ